jgi:hypothetical protein
MVWRGTIETELTMNGFLCGLGHQTNQMTGTGAEALIIIMESDVEAEALRHRVKSARVIVLPMSSPGQLRLTHPAHRTVSAKNKIQRMTAQLV